MVSQNVRPTVDEYMLQLCSVVATRGTCDRLRAGAVVALDRRVMATGYNGSPPGMPHCDDVGHELVDTHCVRTIHSEHNAILQAAKFGGIGLIGTTLYTLYSPCYQCARYIIGVGIKEVVYGEEYRDTTSLEYLISAGVVVRKLKT